jgi:transglutaminase-like putative cysteine protease/uncharacterized protein YxeA
MKRILALILFMAIITAGCTSQQASVSQGDTIYAQAENQYTQENFHAAAELYGEAFRQYRAESNAARAKEALNMASRSVRMYVEFPYNQSVMAAMIDEAYPAASAGQKETWLSCTTGQCITSDGETLYFSDTVGNVRYHNFDLIRNATRSMGKTPFYDQMKSITASPADEGAGPYVNPVRWDGTETLSLPAGLLPKNGTLRLWIPLPVETPSQQDVTIISVEPAQYVISETGTGADLGLAYLEIPLDSVNSDFLNVTTRFRYTQYEVRYTIDPAKVGKYNTSDPEYQKYTASGRNIVVSPEMKAKALSIVGNETNPYLQAEKLYWHVISYPYSHVPHIRLSASGTPESVYMLETGYGDCGTQSMYFAALCRSLGIPARAIGGYQLVPGYAGTHFWSEYYLPGYGWIPNDVTIAEGAEWSYEATDEDRHQYMAFYSSNLDPYRYIIQKDVDVPLTPSPGNAVMFDIVVQSPKAVCDTCDTDPESILMENWKVDVKKA